MKKEALSDIGVLFLRFGLAFVFFYFGLDKFIHMQANASTIASLGFAPFNPTFFTIFQGILEIMIGTFLVLGLFTRIAAGAASFILTAIILVFWFKQHIFLERDVGLLAMALFLLLNGGGRLGLDRYVRVRGMLEKN